MVRVNISLDVPDLEAGLRFYGRVFGWKERSRPLPTMAVLDAGNVTVCMHQKPAGTKPTPAGDARRYERHWTPVHLDLHVDDFAGVLERASAEGATVEHTFAGGERHPDTAFCADPFGNGFCVIQAR